MDAQNERDAMTIKIIRKFNVPGNGPDNENSAVFSARDRFEDLYSRHGEPLHKFMYKKQQVATEPEVRMIASLPGVTEVYSFDSGNLYDLHVKKASAYDWAELVPEIERLLTERGERKARERH
jgi:hypothetical protein